MQRKLCAFRPECSSLETKVLLSLAVDGSPVSANPGEVQILSTATPAASVSADLLRGQYSTGSDNRAADAPLDVKLSGNGKLQEFGRARMSGSLKMGGFLAYGPSVSGTITLTNPKGSVTLRVSGTDGYQQVPDSTLNVSVSVVKGTGAYTNYRRVGTISLAFGPNSATVGSSTSSSGSLKMNLNLSPPAR